MIPRFRPAIGIEELVACWSPTADNAVQQFENQFTRLMGQNHAIAFPYGRTGLYVLLKALGLQGKEIICPAYTCVVVPHAVVASGNEPIFVDSQESDFNMDLDLAEAAINEKTGALIATSIFGYPVDLDKLARLKRQYPHIVIIQDCAHSFAAEWQGRPVQKEGSAAIFGLNISKTMTSIFGGMVTTDDEELAEKIVRIREKEIGCTGVGWQKAWKRRLYFSLAYMAFKNPIYGLVNRMERAGCLGKLVKYYDESLIDMPADFLCGMSPVEAQVGLKQIIRYPDIIKQRRRIAEYYYHQLSAMQGLQPPLIKEGATYSHYVVRTREKWELIQRAGKAGIQLGGLIEYCIPHMQVYNNRPGNRFKYPIALALKDETVNLPTGVSTSQADIVINLIQNDMK